jgi:hypothetical protein
MTALLISLCCVVCLAVVIVSVYVLLLYCFTGRSGSDHNGFVDPYTETITTARQTTQHRLINKAVMIRAIPSSEAVQKKYMHRDNHYSQTDDTTQTQF